MCGNPETKAAPAKPAALRVRKERRETIGVNMFDILEEARKLPEEVGLSSAGLIEKSKYPRGRGVLVRFFFANTLRDGSFREIFPDGRRHLECGGTAQRRHRLGCRRDF